MPKVEQYGQQKITTQVTRSPFAEEVPTAAFGASALAEGLSAAGKAAMIIEDKISTTEAEDALNKFEREKNKLFHDPEGGYFNTQGRDAHDLAGDASERLTKLKQSYSESLGASARQKFDRVAERHVTNGVADITKHAAKGFKAWEVATIKAGVENSIENVALNWGDNEKVALQFELGRAAVRDAAKLEGISGEALNERLQNFDAAAADAAIKAATATSATDGKKALDLYGDRLEGADKAIHKDRIETKSRQEKARDDAIASVSISSNVVNKYDKLSDMQDEVRRKTKHDPELMGKALRELNAQFTMKKNAEQDARTQDFETAENFIYGGGTAEQFKAANPGAWDNLSVKQKKTIESGKGVSTDWNKYNEFMLMTPEQLAKVDPNDYVPHLAKDERNKFYSAYKAARKGDKSQDHQIGRTQAQQTKSAVEQIMGKKQKDWNTDSMAKADKVYSLIDGEVRSREAVLGRSLTTDEFTDVISGMTRAVVQEGTFFDSEIELKDDFLDLPQEEIDILTRTLRHNNLPVTSDNLIRLYEQVRKD